MTEEQQPEQQFDPKDLERIRNFRLLDDVYMTKFFEDEPACTELMLHIILDTTDLTVTRVSTQHSIQNLQGRSVRLDIYAQDSTGKQYNIEVQRADHGADVRRARFNSSLLDANQLKAGERLEALMDTYVIFITEHDVLGAGLPIYHLERIIRETGEAAGDGTHIIYVNAECDDNTPLGQLMQDFACREPDRMHHPILARRASDLKERKEGVAKMCKMLEDMRNEAEAKGARERSLSNARRMLAMGKLSYEEIAMYTELTLEEVYALDEGKSA